MRSFGNRVFFIVVGLVLAIEAITTFAALHALERDALESSSQTLEVGKRVFSDLLATRERELSRGVTVLADDFGFKAAVTSDDETLRSVLANHGFRIGADLVAFVTPDGLVEASTHRLAVDTNEFPIPELLLAGSVRQTSAQVAVLPDGLFQLVVSPVLAPQLIGWVGVGFSIDDAFAADLRSLTGLDVSFVSVPDEWLNVAASTLPNSTRVALADGFAGQSGLSSLSATDTFDLDGLPWIGNAMLLERTPVPVFAVLQQSLYEAMSGYRRLLEQLVAIFLVTIAIAILASRLVAGGVTKPVARLADAARRIAAGDYDKQVEVRRRDELGMLARAFEEMRTGIADREQRIVHQSRHDAMTGLPNRVALIEYIEKAVRRSESEREAGHGALLMIDIVKFKSINDTFGHDTGDDVLRELAERLAAAVRTFDTVARYGPNTFVIVCADVSMNGITDLAGRVLDSVASPLSLPRTSVRLDLSIGVSQFPEHGAEAEKLLRRAEIALHAGRAEDRRVAFYQSGQDEDHLRRLDLIQQLSMALERKELHVVFQPKLDLAAGEVTQAEALVRWLHPRLGSIPPGEFVPIAEQSGLMQALTDVILQKVVEQMAAWSRDGFGLTISANISTIDLRDLKFPDRLIELAHKHGIVCGQLCLEITESALLHDPGSAAQVLARLRSAGFKLSIDDFGTGYSSLIQLKQMPVTELKVDRSFVANLPNSEEDRVIVRSTIDLGHNLGLSVVAEGVEDDETLEILKTSNCDFVQGYGIAKPMEAAAFRDWVLRFREAQSSTTVLPSGERVAV